jgi:hypothetical protein
MEQQNKFIGRVTLLFTLLIVIFWVSWFMISGKMPETKGLPADCVSQLTHHPYYVTFPIHMSRWTDLLTGPIFFAFMIWLLIDKRRGLGYLNINKQTAILSVSAITFLFTFGAAFFGIIVPLIIGLAIVAILIFSGIFSHDPKNLKRYLGDAEAYHIINCFAVSLWLGFFFGLIYMLFGRVIMSKRIWYFFLAREEDEE